MDSITNTQGQTPTDVAHSMTTASVAFFRHLLENAGQRYTTQSELVAYRDDMYTWYTPSDLICSAYERHAVASHLGYLMALDIVDDESITEFGVEVAIVLTLT
jgi:hypothetical protein